MVGTGWQWLTVGGQTLGGGDKEFWSFKAGRFSQHEANRYWEVGLEVKRLEGKSLHCEEGKTRETVLGEHILAVTGEVGKKINLIYFCLYKHTVFSRFHISILIYLQLLKFQQQ